ncbi:MAG: lysophospholipid acyltransferase family protein [Planctomycetota bacterium]|jgi:1-acyl-sn-glycerol-3-phosphate acyltransferase|nr:lysophospholipid acyltransferase family protein [Planctomycetota bacterium]
MVAQGFAQHSRLSAFVRIAAIWIFTALYLFPVVLLQFLTFRLFANASVAPCVRVYGKFALWLLGIRLEIDGQEVLDDRSAKILVANHSSTLDLLILGACFPTAGMALGKKELIWVPFIGLAWWAFRQPLVDRGNREKAIRSVERANRVLKEERRGIWILPEGTRTADGTIGTFKMGAFHMALASGAPIVPVLIIGAAARLPKGQWRVCPGVIRVLVREPIDTSEWKRVGLRKRAENLRSWYCQEVAKERKKMGIDLPVEREEKTQN